MAPEYYTTTCASPSHYTEAPKYYSAPSYTTTTETAKYYAVPTNYTAAAPSYYVEPEYYTEAPVYYTTTYATPSYYTETPKYYNTKAPEYCTTTYAAPTNYTEVPKYYSIPCTTTLRHLNITPHPTLLQLTTGTLLNTRVEFSIIITMFRFVGHTLIITSH
jgi:hypothetical protein